MSARPATGPANVGRLIVAVAVVVAVSLVAIVVSSDRPVRPDLSALPLPEGAVTHAATEDCTGDAPPVCRVDLAVGPAGGIELPRDTEVMLADHLVDEGWRETGPPTGDRERARLVSPDGEMSVRIGDYDAEDVPEDLESGVDEDVAREHLAHVVVVPREDA